MAGFSLKSDMKLDKVKGAGKAKTAASKTKSSLKRIGKG